MARLSEDTRRKIVENGGSYDGIYYRYETETHQASRITYIARRSKLTKRCTLFDSATLEVVH